MHPMLLTAIEAVREAGKIILMHFDRLDRVGVTPKGHNDFVSQADIEAERVIIDILMRRYPDHGFVAEEGGSKKGQDYTWIIDPLDGTTNFLHGFPTFAISVAAVRGEDEDYITIMNAFARYVGADALDVDQLASDLNFILVDKAKIGSELLDRVRSAKSRGGFMMYAESYRWFAETSGPGLADQSAQLMNPKTASKEEDIAGAISFGLRRATVSRATVSRCVQEGRPKENPDR